MGDAPKEAPGEPQDAAGVPRRHTAPGELVDTSRTEETASQRARRRWALARQKVIVDRKGKHKVVEVRLDRSGGGQNFGLQRIIRKIPNAQGLMMWEDPKEDLIFKHNENMKRQKKKHLMVVQYSVIIEVNGKRKTDEMFAEIAASKKISMKVRVPRMSGGQHMDEIVEIMTNINKVKKQWAAEHADEIAKENTADELSPSKQSHGGDSVEAQELAADIQRMLTRESSNLPEQGAGSGRARHKTQDIDMVEDLLKDPEAYAVFAELTTTSVSSPAASFKKKGKRASQNDLKDVMEEMESIHVEKAKENTKGFFARAREAVCSCTGSRTEGPVTGVGSAPILPKSPKSPGT